MSRKEKAKRKRARERRTLKRRLLSYSLAAGAALVGANHASAEIMYSGPQNIMVHAGNPTVGIDFDGGGNEVRIDFTVAGTHWVNTWQAGGSTWMPFTTTGGGTSPGYGYHVLPEYYMSTGRTWRNVLSVNPYGGASVVDAGDMVNEAAAVPGSQFVGPTMDGAAYWAPDARALAVSSGSAWWWDHALVSTTGWVYSFQHGNFVDTDGYIGVRFDVSDNGEPDWRYGWIQFEGTSTGSPGSLYGLITGWAYDDTGAPIHVVPEPSGLALLATGAAGVMALRKKRKRE